MDKLSLLTMTAEGTAVGIMLRQLSDGSWKLSLRTDGSVHAGRVFKRLGGGGHPDAAGAVLNGDPAEMESTILAAYHEEKQIRI